MGEDASEHCRPEVSAELVQVLMRQHEPKTVLPGLGNDLPERVRRKVLELIHVQHERSSPDFRQVGARQRGELDLRDEQGPEEERVLFEDSLREVRQEPV